MKIAVFAVAALLTGCATTSDVVSMGKDSYMLTVSNPAANGGALKIKSVTAANTYCAKTGKLMIVRSIESEGAAPARTGSGSIIFSCVDESDPEYQRPNLRPAPTTVIEDARH